MKIKLSIILTIIFGCMTKIDKPPTALKIPHKLTMHGDTRLDNYYWMRLTDDQKNAKKKMRRRKMLLTTSLMRISIPSLAYRTPKLQNTIFDEMVSRIKKDDESVPYLKNGYYYYSRFEKDQEYPIYCRKKDL